MVGKFRLRLSLAYYRIRDMNWFPLVIAGAFASALSNLLIKVGLHHRQVDPLAFGSAFQLVAATYTLPWLVLQPPTMPSDPILWALLGLSCVCYTSATFFWFRAIKLTDVSEVSIFLGTRPLWVLTAGLVLGREAAGPFKFVLMLVVIGGLVIVFYEKGKFRFGGPERMAFLATISFSCSSVIDSYLSPSFSPNVYQLVTFVGPALGLLVVDPGAVRRMGSLAGRRAILGLVSSSLMLLLAVTAVYLAYRYGDASRVVAAFQLSAIMTVLLSALFVNERNNLPRKLAGSIVVVIGVTFLRV